MSREEIVNNIGYQMTMAAKEYIEKHEFADAMDAFEAGAEWMQKQMIDKACEWMMNLKIANGEFPLYDYVGNFRKAMEE